MNDYSLETTEPVQVLAVASGKRGVGKTDVAVNLAAALANRGHRVLLVDTTATAELGHLLGQAPGHDLGDLVAGACQAADLLREGPSGVALISANAGKRNLAQLRPGECAAAVAALQQLPWHPEIVVIDTHGNGSDTLRLAQAASEVLLVLDDSDAGMAATHDLVRRLRRGGDCARLRVLANRVPGELEGQVLHERLVQRVERDADVALHYVGAIPDDTAMKRARGRRQPVINYLPASACAQAFKRLARRTEAWAPPPHASGGLAYFLERLGRAANPGKRQAQPQTPFNHRTTGAPASLRLAHYH